MGLELLWTAFTQVVFGGAILYVFAGILIGMTFGILPGLGGTTALALLLPFTYSMDSLNAIYLAGGIMGATSFSGSITSILLNTPGTAPNAATTFDGYPMAQQGRAGEAIGASAAASALGGLIGLFTLVLIIPIARELVLAFGPGEQFLLTLLALVAISVSARGKLLRGLIAAGFGLMLAFVGFDSVSGEVRFTLGIDYFWDGVPVVPTLTGLFAMAQMQVLALRGGSVADAVQQVDRHITGLRKGIVAVFQHWRVLLRGSAIGTIVGILPGVGGTVASFIAYTDAVQASRDPESFGKGNIVGVIAPESANNAKDGGSLLPTLAFGIPGSAETALFLGIMVVHGMEPGPMILIQNEREIYGLIMAVTLSAVGASLVGLLLARWLVLVTRVNVQYLVPVVMVLSLCGVYALKRDPGDIVVCLVMGFVGYIMLRFDFPRLALVIALILGETAERSFHQTRMISDQEMLTYFLGRPQAVLLMVLIVGAVLIPALRRKNEASRPRVDS